MADSHEVGVDGGFVVLAIVGIVANEPDRPSEKTAEQEENEQADPREIGPAKIVRDTRTRIEMPPIPEAHQVTMTWQEFSETYNGQPSLPVRVKQIENIDFTSGPNGEPIWRCFFGTGEEGKKGRWGDAYFYIDKDNLPPPFNNDTATQRDGGLSEPEYDRDIPPDHWVHQCPECGARWEHAVGVCWNCGYGNNIVQCAGCGEFVKEPNHGDFETCGVICPCCTNLIRLR